MHLVLANQWYPPESGWGGVAMWNLAMARAFRDLGHRVTVIASRRSKAMPVEHNADGIRVHRLLVRDPYRLRRLPAIGRYIRPAQQLLYSARVNRALKELFVRDSFDLVEFAEVNAEGYFYARDPLTPFVVRCHTPTFILKDYYTRREMPYDTAIISLAEKYLIRRAPALTAPSCDMAHQITETTDVRLERITVVPNALTLSDFQPPNDLPVQSSDSLTILFVGRLERAKGVQVLAQAIPQIVSQLPGAHFIFIGDDLPNERGASQRSNLETILRRANASASVQFTGGVDQATLIDGYRRADICVVPSLLYESFSYTAAQAMAFGKPVVASRVGGIPETVDDGVSGILCEPGDVGQFTDAILRLAGDPELRVQMGRAGRAKVEHEFDARVIAEKNFVVYARAVESFRKTE